MNMRNDDLNMHMQHDIVYVHYVYMYIHNIMFICTCLFQYGITSMHAPVCDIEL